jgi:hypothetical protein
MALRDVALAIKQWALSNQMMGETLVTPVTPAVDAGLIRNVFGRTGVPLVTQILQNRRITYIGINEVANSIVIFTSKKLVAREQKLLANIGGQAGGVQFHLEFVHSGFAHAGGLPPPPPGIRPYTEHNGRYTCGSSIFIAADRGAGTLGCLTRDAAGELYGLSNNHVTAACNYAPPGFPIVAPGMLDVSAGGRDPATIGHHYRAVPFIDGIPEIVGATDNLDAALFKIADGDAVSSMQRDAYDTPANTMPLAVTMEVQKVGRTSGRTSGVVIAEMIPLHPIRYDVDMIKVGKLIWFQGLFGIQSTNGLFSHQGDSGSLIVHVDQNQDRHAVGIVVGSTPEGLTLALSIERILTYFDVSLVSGHNV